MTSLLPSGNVGSTWIMETISGTPSMTSFFPKISLPALMISATDLPSRASSSSSAVIRAIDSGTLSLRPRALRLGDLGGHED